MGYGSCQTGGEVFEKPYSYKTYLSRLSESLFLQDEGVQFDEPPMVLPNHEIESPTDSEVPEAFKRSVFLGCVWLSCPSRKREGEKTVLKKEERPGGGGARL